MEKHIGCCGFKCHTCAAYYKNVNGEEGKKEVADKWKYYFDYEISPEKMMCHGCSSDECQCEYLVHPDCQIRNCVLDKGVEKCTDCEEYPCQVLTEYLDMYKEAYEMLKAKIIPGDAEGYFLTYLVDEG